MSTTTLRINGEKLRAARHAACLSQQELGDRAGGIRSTTVSNLERGTRTARRRTVRALATALGVEPAAIILIDDAVSGSSVR